MYTHTNYQNFSNLRFTMNNETIPMFPRLNLGAQVLCHGLAEGPDSTQQIRLAGHDGYLAPKISGKIWGSVGNGGWDGNIRWQGIFSPTRKPRPEAMTWKFPREFSWMNHDFWGQSHRPGRWLWRTGRHDFRWVESSFPPKKWWGYGFTTKQLHHPIYIYIPWCWVIFTYTTGWFWTRAVLLGFIFQHHGACIWSSPQRCPRIVLVNPQQTIIHWTICLFTTKLIHLDDLLNPQHFVNLNYIILLTWMFVV